MAHYLSDVTHERLQQRANLNEAANPDRVRTYIPGLTHTHDFMAILRCIAVLERSIEDEKMGPNAVVKSWSGDLDGCISIRHGLDGRVVRKIPQEHQNVFVFALQQYKDTMWAGLSNGYLVVYEISTARKIFEAKAHGGAINRFLLGGDKMFIASADWQISQWNAVEMTRIMNGNFSGHTNAVRCMALDGTLLYTGGDDCVIRCWDLNTNTERTGTWPIIAHHDSVRDIVIFDSFLFSSSTDGTINVWNIRTAQLVRQLEVVNASITTLCLDSASNYLWAGSSDGKINIWNAATLSLVGAIDDHENTNVAAVRQVARVDAIKAWTVCDDGNVRIWYADSNPTDEEYLQVSQMEAELQQHIEDHRNRIIGNYEELEKYKRELGVLEQQSSHKKNRLAHLLGKQHEMSLERKHMAFAMIWLDKQRYKTWRELVTAPLVEKINNKTLLARYYAGWQVIARERHAVKHKKDVAGYMAEYQKEISIRAYLQKLNQTQQATIAANTRNNLANALARTNKAILVDRYYNVLKQYVASRNTFRRMEQLSHCLAQQTNRAILESYWQKLLQSSEQARADRLAANVVTVIKNIQDRYDNSIEKAQHEEKLAEYDNRYGVLQDKQDQITQYKFQLVEDRDHTLAMAAAKAEEDEIKELEAFIKANEGHDEDALDKELMEKQMELIRVSAASEEDLEAQIRALEMRNFKLTREHEKDVVVRIDTTLTPLQQVDHAMYLLKANGVSCYHHTERRQQVRELISACKSAEKVYKEAFLEFKKLITKAVKPIPLQDGDQPEWFAPREYLDWMKRPKKAVVKVTDTNSAEAGPSDAIKGTSEPSPVAVSAEQRARNIKFRNKAILEANNSIIDLCVAYDTLVPKQRNAWVTGSGTDNQFGHEYQHNKELIANIEIFNTIALRSYRILRKLDPITGEPKKSARDSSKSPSRGRSASPRGKSKSVGATSKKKKTGKKKAEKSTDGTTKKKKGTKKTVPKKKKSDKTEKKGVKKTAKKKTGGKKKKKTTKLVATEASPEPAQLDGTLSPSASPETNAQNEISSHNNTATFATPLRHDDDETSAVDNLEADEVEEPQPIRFEEETEIAVESAAADVAAVVEEPSAPVAESEEVEEAAPSVGNTVAEEQFTGVDERSIPANEVAEEQNAEEDELEKTQPAVDHGEGATAEPDAVEEPVKGSELTPEDEENAAEATA